MNSTSGTSKTLALAAGSLLVVATAVVGCSNQYADMGTIDVTASKAKANELGLKKFEPKLAKSKPSSRRAAPKTEKTIAPPTRGALPK